MARPCGHRRMATQTKFEVVTQPLANIPEMDHIVLRTRDVEESLRFYIEILGLEVERVEQWWAGELRLVGQPIQQVGLVVGQRVQ